MATQYVFDPTGTLQANLITNEAASVSAATGQNLSFVVPDAAPFFRRGLVVQKIVGSSSVVMQEGIDYILTHRFIEACNATSKEIFGSIAFLDRTLTANIRLRYQTLGGNWALQDKQVVKDVTNQIYNIFNVSWSQIAGMPVTFPPIIHDHGPDDLIGMSDTVNKLEEIRQTLLAGYGDQTQLINALNEHITNPDTAHTKFAVGLGNVLNYEVASIGEVGTAISGDLIDIPNRYITLLRLRNYFDGYGFKSGAKKDIELPGDAPAQPNPYTIQLANGAFINFSVSLDSPAQPTQQINLKNGAFTTVTLPPDPPNPIPADTLPLKNGAFTKIVVSSTAPLAPEVGMLWLQPILD